MKKTLMSQKKRTDLYPLVYKVVAEKHQNCDFGRFVQLWEKRIAAELDKIIIDYYGPRFMGEYDWLKEQGLLIQQDVFISYEASTKHQRQLNNFFDFRFPAWFRPTLFYGVNTPINKDENIQKLFDIFRHNLFDEGTYAIACCDFCDRVLEKAKPLLKLVDSAKFCEDILEYWDTPEVRKVLFPDKQYSVATLTSQDISFLKELLK